MTTFVGEPLRDTLRTSVAGVGSLRISELAERTVRVAGSRLAEPSRS